MVTIKLEKSNYSESVIRKSLYWLSEVSDWQLQEDSTSWDVMLNTISDEQKFTIISELHRLMNDFILREKLDNDTLGMRNQIVVAALQGLMKDE